MDKLEEYDTLDSKRNYFSKDMTNITSKDQLIDVIKELSKRGKKLFRGVSEAKYKLYTSGQREFIQQDYYTLDIQYVQFMKALLQNLRNNVDLMDYCKVANIHPNDSYCFTYLQHYGAPTPYIDLTMDIKTALFFCIHNMSVEKAESEIDHYCSLYYIEETEIDYITKRYEQIIERDKTNPIPNPQDKNYLKQEMLKLENLQKMELFYIDSSTTEGYFNQKRLIFRMPNRNMVAQKGVLLYNSSDELPLEKRLKQIHCINIHKSLCDFIRNNYLESVTKDKLFPNEYHIAQGTYKTFKTNLA